MGVVKTALVRGDVLVAQERSFRMCFLLSMSSPSTTASVAGALFSLSSMLSQDDDRHWEGSDECDADAGVEESTCSVVITRL